MTNQELLKLALSALEVSQALDMQFKDGLKVLEHHGFDHSDRFDVPATKFVSDLQQKAIHAIRENERK